MALAALRRPVQHERPAGPVRPPFDPGKGRAVALGDEEIGRSERRLKRQIDRELGHRRRVMLAAGSVSGGAPL